MNSAANTRAVLNRPPFNADSASAGRVSEPSGFGTRQLLLQIHGRQTLGLHAAPRASSPVLDGFPRAGMADARRGHTAFVPNEACPRCRIRSARSSGRAPMCSGIGFRVHRSRSPPTRSRFGVRGLRISGRRSPPPAGVPAHRHQGRADLRRRLPDPSEVFDSGSAAHPRSETTPGCLRGAKGPRRDDDVRVRPSSPPELAAPGACPHGARAGGSAGPAGRIASHRAVRCGARTP